MSGFVGIVRFDGVPVDAGLLRRLTDAMRFRGPESQTTWMDAEAGLGHALLATANDTRCGQQPLTLDGNAWIVADARLDARRELIRELHAKGRQDLHGASDAALMLHAYAIWGERAVEHLRGDFAFAIWDRGARRLWAGRDQIGVKPLYYARITGGWVVGDTLSCLRLHPDVTDGVDDSVIGDFLLFGLNDDPHATFFADIRKVAPACSIRLSADNGGCASTSRYWTMPLGGRIRYRDPHEYVAHFRELLDQAVADRLPTDTAGVWMSGGLDSTAVAATARRYVERGSGLRAQTVVYDSLIADDERRFAGNAAQALDVPVDFVVADCYPPLSGWDDPRLLPVEPLDDPSLSMHHDVLQRAAAHARVWLSGDGGDELLRASYVTDVFARLPFSEFLAAALCTVKHRRRPGFGLRATARRWLGLRVDVPPFPDWIDAAFESRCDLRQRWNHAFASPPAGNHAVRPEAQRGLAATAWAATFESYDPGATGVTVEYRTPFLDTRLIEYALAIPPLPWCVDKHLLRCALRGLIPEAVRLRPKTPLAGDPVAAHARLAPIEHLPFDIAEEVAPYVRLDKVRGRLDSGSDARAALRALYLGQWVRHRVRGNMLSI
jgi:asparagine synthase (glutamine-hydrolysing)